MRSDAPWVLVSNDDGMHSPVLPLLVKALAEYANIIVSVPTLQQSGVGKSISYRIPLRVKSMKIDGAQESFAVEGTPAAAVLYALRREKAQPIDLVVSGINIGPNPSVYNVFASGTLGAAIEGALHNIPAIAFSVLVPSLFWYNSEDPALTLQEELKFTKKLVKLILTSGLPKGVDLLNVNFPSTMTPQTPVIIPPMAKKTNLGQPQQREDVYGAVYYWIGFDKTLDITPGTDVDLLVNKQSVTISPITLDVSNLTLRQRTQAFFLDHHKEFSIQGNNG